MSTPDPTPGIIDSILIAIGEAIAVIINAILENLSETFIALLQEITALITQISTQIRRIFDALIEVIDSLFDRISEFIQTTISQIIEFIDEVLSTIINKISDFIDIAQTAIGTVTDRVIEFVRALFEAASDFLSELFDTVTTNIIAIVDTVKLLFIDIFDFIVDKIGLIIDRVITFFKGLFDTVRDGIITVLDIAGTVVQTIIDAVESFISSVVDVVGASLRDLLETIASLPDALTEFSGLLVQSAIENIGKPLIELPVKLIEEIVERVTGVGLKETDKMELNTLNLVFGTSPITRSPEVMRDLVKNIIPEHPILRAIVISFIAIFSIIPTIGGLASANAQIILQEHALTNPYRLIEPPDVVRALHFDLIEQGIAIEELRKTGYTESAALTLIGIGERIPPEGEQIIWWLREFIDDSQLQRNLLAQGWSEQSIDALKKAAFFIPPVQDLITMAVREVFTPDIAARFGQFEDLPAEFVDFASQQGVSSEWAERYWGAHWALPSVQMGFEMLHRQVITEDDLKLLLRASDVMPFWRDKLVEISFSPLTRVDIRRMHKLDVLTVEEVNRAYHDIGYNDLNAQRLTDFTIALNAPSVVEDDTDLTTLTRTNILGFFKDGVLKRDVATSLLLGAGLSQAAADLFLDGIELELQRQERTDEITIIIDQANAGVLTFEEAQDRLDALGLETLEKELAVTKLRKQEARRTKLPSRADLDKMFRKNIIGKEEYIDNVQRLGFSELWANRYLQLLGG